MCEQALFVLCTIGELTRISTMVLRCGFVLLILMSAHNLTRANFTVQVGNRTTTPQSTTATASLSSQPTRYTQNMTVNGTNTDPPGDTNINVTKSLQNNDSINTLESQSLSVNHSLSPNTNLTIVTSEEEHRYINSDVTNFPENTDDLMDTVPPGPVSGNQSSHSERNLTQIVSTTVTSREKLADINMNVTKIVVNKPAYTVQSKSPPYSYSTVLDIPPNQNEESSKSYADHIVIKNIHEQSNRTKDNPISDLLLTLCGYQMSCYDRKHGIIKSKRTTCCDFCSCDVTTCQISNNCCPTVQPIMDQPDPTPTCRLQHNIFTNIIKSKQQLLGNHSEKITNSNKTEDCTVTNLSMNGKSCIKKDSTARTTDPGTYNLEDITVMFPDFAEARVKYLVISSCPENHSDNYTVAQCTREDSEYLVHYLPTSDWIKSRTYRNIYCAKCNNASATMPWMVQTDCPHLYTEIFPSRVDHLSNVVRDCSVNLISKRFLSITTCQTDDTKNVIRSCNVTGKWKEYDQYIEQMCMRNASVSIYDNSEYQSDGIYRNVFCYLCNIDKTEEKLQKCSSKQSPPIQEQSTDSLSPPTFRAMIDVTLPVFCGYSPDKLLCANNLANTASTCPYHSFIDYYTNTCRQLICPVSSTAMKVMCIKKHLDVSGLTMTGRIQFTTKQENICGAPNMPACDQHFFQDVHQDFDRTMRISSYYCIPEVAKILHDASDDGLQEFYAIYRITNTIKCPVTKVLSIFSKLQEPVLINKDIKLYSQMIFDNVNEDNFKFKISFTNKSIHETVLLNASFNCPRVVLTLKEYHQYVKNSYINPIQEHVLKHQYTMDTGNVEICFQHFMRQYLRNKIAPSSTDANPIAIQLSIVSSLISIASILLVLITYGIFSDLRFLPGKLLMTLCVNLLLAQVLYLFGMNLGIDNIWCKLIGVCIHMFWLATVFSMNSCLRLMVQNFNSPLQEDNRMLMQSRSNSQVLKSFLSCYCIPISCVLVNMIMSYLQTPSSCGYGGKLCYITTPMMRMYTFAVPLGIVVLINFCMFAVIMMKICKAMHNYNTVCMKQIVIFCKLSTITGMYWGFGFLYEATEIPIFSYFFIIFNAGQGFFLMWSFLFNTRVFEMYKLLFRRYMRKINTEWTFSAIVRELEARGKKPVSLQNPQYTSSV